MIPKILLSIAVVALPIQMAEAQQPRLVCPKLSPDMRRAVVNKMIQQAKEGRYVGCTPRYEGGPPNFECTFEQTFSFESKTFPITLGFPWSFTVGCFPELGPVASLNEKAQAAKEAEKVRVKESEEKAEREMQAKIGEPKYVLTRTYYDYIQVKGCYERRKGYLVTNISSAEMGRAKAAAKVLETFALEKDSTLDKDQLWKLAGSDSTDWMIQGDKSKLMATEMIASAMSSDPSERSRCQVLLGALEDRAKRLVPSSAAVKKDF